MHLSPALQDLADEGRSILKLIADTSCVQALADKKKDVADEDILALVSDEVHQPEKLWDLLDLQVCRFSSTLNALNLTQGPLPGLHHPAQAQLTLGREAGPLSASKSPASLLCAATAGTMSTQPNFSGCSTEHEQKEGDPVVSRSTMSAGGVWHYGSAHSHSAHAGAGWHCPDQHGHGHGPSRRSLQGHRLSCASAGNIFFIILKGMKSRNIE